jgi:hypothetical protein
MGRQKLENLTDAAGPVYEVGRGVTDPRITYLALYNTSGDKCYIYPNAAGNGLEVTPVRP